jgi:hypothetical protein
MKAQANKGVPGLKLVYSDSRRPLKMALEPGARRPSPTVRDLARRLDELERRNPVMVMSIWDFVVECLETSTGEPGSWGKSPRRHDSSFIERMRELERVSPEYADVLDGIAKGIFEEYLGGTR